MFWRRLERIMPTWHILEENMKKRVGKCGGERMRT